MGPKVFFSGMFFFMIPCRILIVSFPFYGLAKLSTIFIGLQYLCIITSIIYTINHPNIYKNNRYNRYLILIFLVYTLYSVNYTFLSPKLPIDMIQNMPESPFAMAMSSFCIISCLFLASIAKQFIDFKLFAKLSVVVIVLALFLYFYRVDYTLYALQKTMKLVDARDFGEENGMHSSLLLNSYASVAYVCNLFCKNEWSNRKIINNIIFYFVSIYLIFISLVLGERGPVLFLITTTLFFYSAKERISFKFWGSILFLVFFLLYFGTDVLTMISSFAPDIVERTISVADDGASGRIGGDDSLFSASIFQILENPIFGSYHRLLSVSWIGTYPHNLVLEALMTFGVFFSFPLFVLIWKAVQNSYEAIKNGEPISLFCLLFFHFTSCLMTSNTIFLNNFFWTTFAIALTYQKKIDSINL